MHRCATILGSTYDATTPYSLVMGGSVTEPPNVGAMARPFESASVFQDAKSFLDRLEVVQATEGVA